MNLFMYMEPSKSESYHIRPIEARDATAIANLIRKVMPEFGASGNGFAIHDVEVDNMYGAYANSRSAYFVVVHHGEIVGGGGIAPLEGGADNVCELRKMYFVENARGRGIGRELMRLCLKAAKERGFDHCYLETLATMTQACALYEKSGFKPLPGPLGNTGHFGCNSWYIKKI